MPFQELTATGGSITEMGHTEPLNRTGSRIQVVTFDISATIDTMPACFPQNTDTGKAPRWIPFEIRLKIVKQVRDMQTLASLRLVDRSFKMVVEHGLSSWVGLGLSKAAIRDFHTKVQDKKARNKVTDAVVITPDRDYWNVSVTQGTPCDVIMETNRGSKIFCQKQFEMREVYRRYTKMRFLWKTRLHLFSNIKRLTIHVRPIKVKPTTRTGELYQQKSLLKDMFYDFLDSAQSFGNQKPSHRHLQDLSIQSIPISQEMPVTTSRNIWSRRFYYEVPSVLLVRMRDLCLTSLKIGLMTDQAWMCDDQKEVRSTFSI